MHVGKVEVDDALIRNEVGDALDSLPEDVIHLAERLGDGCALVDDLHQAVVRNGDDGIDVLLQVLDARVCVARTRHPLIGEGTRHNGDGQCAEFTRTLCHDGSCARSRAAAHTSRDKDHIRTAQCL